MSWRRVAKAGMLIVLLALAVELVLQALALVAPDRSGSWREGAGYRVLAVGDSHTWGSGVGRAGSYPGQLQRALDAREPGLYSVVNLGLPGMSTSQLRNRLPVLLSRYRPDAVVVWCGANNRWNHAERDRATTPALLRLDGWLTRLRSYRLVRVWLHDRPLEKIARERAGAAWEVERRRGAAPREQRFTIRHEGVEEAITHERGGPTDDASLYDRTLADLEAIAANAGAAGVHLTLVTYPIEEGFFATTNRAIREAARRGGLSVVESPRALARIPREEQTWEWALHPDARLYGEVAADLVPVLEAVRRGSEGFAPRSCAEALEPLARGFGAPGPHVALREDRANPRFPRQAVSVFTPRGVEDPVPVVVFAHGNGSPDPASYAGLIRHVVSRGHALVYPSHQTEGLRHEDRYAALWAGVRAAVDAHADRLDPGRLGLVGHSYGAGALFHLAHRALVEEGWGAEGAFLLSMAPWYALSTEERGLGDVRHLKALFLLFEDDGVTDHRIAISQWEGLPDEIEADLVMLRSDRRGGCALPAVHAVPQSGGLGGRDDALDERAVFRLFDALSAYALRGDPEGRRVALGRGDPAQVSMGAWRDGTPLLPLLWSASPEAARPESAYLFAGSAEAEWSRYAEPAQASPPERDAPRSRRDR